MNEITNCFLVNVSLEKMDDRSKEEDDRPRRWRRPSRTQAFWVFLILVLIFAGKFFDSTPSEAPNISYRQYRDFLEAGQIDEAVIIGESEFHGILSDGGTFVVNLGPIDAVTKREWQQDFNLDFKFKDEPFKWSNVIFNVLPWILFLGFWVFMLRQMQGGSRGLFSFGKSRAKILTGEMQKTTFEDIAGVDEAKEELSEIIDFLKDPQSFQRLGGRIPKGVLMVGPPGTGKTHLARAISGEAEVPFFSISGSDFVEMFVGVGASRVRDLFEQGKNSAPCIIFIDEIDAVGRQRGAGIGGGHDEREQTLNQLLVEMDGFQSNDGVVLIAATNRPDVLDPALLRPGRFDRRVVVDLPDIRGREEILRIHVRKVPLAEEVDLKRIAQATPGLSGADLANLINEAALFASRKGRDSVDRSDIEGASDKVMMGNERRSMLLNEEDRTISAYHEAGHALVAKSLPEAQKIGKVTIIPRGQAMGLVSFLPDERKSISETRLKACLATALGGRCAEHIVFSERSTGAQSDYKQVASLARSMICEWGMNQELGPIAVSNREEEVFLAKGFTQTGSLSDETTQLIDREIRNLVREAEVSATEILRERIGDLHVIAKALLKYEVLDDTDLDKLLDMGVVESDQNLSDSDSFDQRGK